ncbi:ran-binding protein 3 [Plakobranchus ocellatus]|uniref:Ran-binding protein 3 n=1 Tax=Plakobranchus ocellatus TaxID=259542 RepID=A0AAV4D6V8_9GAST|nr:ran-binding protein 3 [Plakobranchus ocellatus]
MADSVADSTKNEEDSTEAIDSNVSSSHNSCSQGPEISGGSRLENEGSQVVSSSDSRELPQPMQPTHPVIQPSKFQGASQGFWCSYSNPFVPRPPLRTDVVSTASCPGEERESIIAPSRFSAAVSRSSDDRSKSYLRPSVLSGARAADHVQSDAPSSTHNSFHLRPSVFSGQSDSTMPKAPLLKPAKLPDPTKISDGKVDSAVEPDASDASEKSASEVSVHCERLSGADDAAGGKEVSSSSSTCSSHLGLKQTEVDGAQSYNHEIVPDIAKNNKLKDSSGVSSSSQSGFVFGSNLSQRVTGVTPGEDAKEASASTGFVFGENLAAKVKTETNGASDSPHKDDSDSDSGKMNRTLEESAREYQAKHENKTELKEVERITGEEEESNVLQANAKLFLFDSSSQSWVERGRGIIRLNDRSSNDTKAFQSRLVMRTQGSLRVVLNTKIWPGMTIERASAKSVRITAMDTDESIKIFLIMTNTKDSENLLRAIDWRIQELKIQEEPSRTLTSDSRAGDKRKAASDFEYPNKSKKLSSPSDSGSYMLKKDESDSSVQDPETEASCESHSSSLTVKSESD